MQFANARILIFAKSPDPGAVKTRMFPALSPERAAALHAAMIEFTLERCVGVAPVVLLHQPAEPGDFFLGLAERGDLELRPQLGADLGERMANAAAQALSGVDFALLIGCDCPPLSPAHLAQACAELAAGKDAVVGPAEDGGYVLLGLRRTDPRLFEQMPWGSAEVLAATRQRLRELGFTWAELPVLWDLDRPDDLQRLRSELPGLAQRLSAGEDQFEDRLGAEVGQHQHGKT